MSTITISIIVSVITTKIVATYYFKKVDGYVKEMCEMTNKNNEKTLAILHKLQRNSLPKEQRSMAAELTINKSLTANGTIKVDDKIVMSLFTELSTSANGTDRVTQSIQDKETYNKNKKEIRAQVAAFQEAVWDMQDSMEEADSTTGEDTTDETQE